jgi:hypothetical protein
MSIKRRIGRVRDVRSTQLLKVPNGIWIVGILEEAQIE